MRVWIYCRVANKTGVFMDPCEQQRMKLMRYAAEKGWQVVGVSSEITKGAGLERLALKAAEDAVRLGLADRVLVTQADRVSRNGDELWEWYGRLKACGGDLLTTEETEFFPIYEKIACYFRGKMQREKLSEAGSTASLFDIPERRRLTLLLLSNGPTFTNQNVLTRLFLSVKIDSRVRGLYPYRAVASRLSAKDRWTLDEHLLFQRRLCRDGVALMSAE